MCNPFLEVQISCSLQTGCFTANFFGLKQYEINPQFMPTGSFLNQKIKLIYAVTGHFITNFSELTFTSTIPLFKTFTKSISAHYKCGQHSRNTFLIYQVFIKKYTLVLFPYCNPNCRMKIQFQRPIFGPTRKKQ